MKASTLVLVLFFSVSAFAQTKVAIVKLIRGEADVLTLGKTTKLKVDDWVQNGDVIKTAEKSFVKLIFVDKSLMNVGPKSEMKIESFAGKDSGVIDLVKGKIRAQVTKDYLQIKDRDKSKLFIKTPNAVMGVRGTDFMISTNGTNTATVLFEGEIVFNKLDSREDLSSSRLEEIVDRGVKIYPGEFSVMEANRPLPTVPSLLNVQQKENLEKNQEFNSDRSPSNAGTDSAKSVVPAGLNGQVVSNSSDTLKNEVAQVGQVTSQTSSTTVNPDGFIKGDMVKPANGSFVHVETGIIIPPGPGSVLDKNTNTYIPSQDSGKIATDGSYIPPRNTEITDDGKVLVASPDKNGNMVVKEVRPPSPVIVSSQPSAPMGAPRGSSDVPLPNQGGFDPRFAPNGGFMGSNDPARVQSDAQPAPTTIRVKPE
jgi:hypothetical protein